MLPLPMFPTLSTTLQVCTPESTALRASVAIEWFVCLLTKHDPVQVDVHVYITSPIGCTMPCPLCPWSISHISCCGCAAKKAVLDVSTLTGIVCTVGHNTCTEIQFIMYMQWGNDYTSL